MRSTGLEPVRLPIRPSNVRVCQFHHDRVIWSASTARLIIQADFMLVNNEFSIPDYVFVILLFIVFVVEAVIYSDGNGAEEGRQVIVMNNQLV